MASYEVGFKPASIGSTLGVQASTRTSSKADYILNGSSIPAVHLVSGAQIIKRIFDCQYASGADHVFDHQIFHKHSVLPFRFLLDYQHNQITKFPIALVLDNLLGE